MHRFPRRSLLIALLAVGTSAGSDAPALSPDVKAALDRISADSLKGHISFLASDLLEGRGTPSRGLDIAAEYIAAQFRRAGLEPAGDDGFFQTAKFLSLEPVSDGLRFEVSGMEAVEPDKLTADTTVAVSLRDAPAVKAADGQSVAGKVVFVHAADTRAAFTARRRMASAPPALLVITGPGAVRMRTRGAALLAEEDRGKSVPVITVRDEALAAKIEAAPDGPLPFTVTANVTAPSEKRLTLRNVVAVLKGSDPVLKDSYALVTAHYDHLGVRGDGPDKIYNGANDDASGVASMIDIAAAIHGLNPRPRRSIVFIALFGEEAGLLGSRYYGAHPLFPLARTIANINLEHMGRTDSGQGSNLNMADFTGFDYSTVPAIFRKAGELVGVKVEKDGKNSDLYFGRSDNQTLADLGVPAHTISVTYEFPDYHRAGDEWQKLDYDNMARVDRMVALGLLMLAGDAEVPRWNEAEPKAKKYLDAAKAAGRQ